MISMRNTEKSPEERNTKSTKCIGAGMITVQMDLNRQ